MEVRELNMGQLKSVYTYMQKDFPQDELKPLYKLFQLMANGSYKLYGYFDNMDMVAYALILHNENVGLLDYFAVMDGKRDNGIGTMFLSELMRGFNLAGELAMPSDVEDETLCIRRVNFYERMGWRIRGELDLHGVRYWLISIGSVALQGVRDLYKCMYGTNWEMGITISNWG